MPKNNTTYSRSKTLRCKWYNDLGIPRINGRKQLEGDFNFVGCNFTAETCFYAHPDHPAWRYANPSRPPKAHEYADGRVPNTPPPPPRSNLLKRLGTPERMPDARAGGVKNEPISPREPFLESSAAAAGWERKTEKARMPSGSGPSTSPSRRRKESGGDYDWKYYERRERERRYREDEERRERKRDRRSRSPSRSRESRHNRSRSRSPYTSREHERKRERARTTDVINSPTFFDHISDLSNVNVPSKPRALRSPLASADHTPLPPTPTDPPPLLPPPPPPSFAFNSTPVHKPDSSIASTPRESVPPDTAGSFAMPPPPTPASTSSMTQTQVQSRPATTSAPPTPLLLNTFQPEEGEVLTKNEPLSREEQAELWDKRIDLLSEAILAKKAHKDRLLDIKQLSALSTPARTAHLPSAVRAQIDESMQTAQAHADAAETRARTAHQRVLDLDFWPVRRRPETYDAAKREEIAKEAEERMMVQDTHVELRGKVGELGDAVGRIDRQMKEVTAFVKSRSRTSVPASNSVSDPSSMDWEPTDATGRGSKRRKVGDDSAYASDSGSATLVPLSPTLTPTDGAHLPLPTHDARLTAHRIAKLESQLQDLENLYTQAEAHAQDELAALVEGHVERVREEMHRRLRVKHAERVERLEEEGKQMGREVSELVDEVATLVGVKAEVGEMKREVEEKCENDRKEIEKIRASLAESALQTASIEARQAASTSEIDALRRSLTLLTQAPPTPPPHMPTVAELTSALLPGLLDAIRADMLRTLEAQKRDVVSIMREAVPTLEQAAQGLLANGKGVTEGSVSGKGKGKATMQVNGNVAPPKPPS